RIFFFSSRRRHTRSKRDWSSDVCSSDLLLLLGKHRAACDAFARCAGPNPTPGLKNLPPAVPCAATIQSHHEIQVETSSRLQRQLVRLDDRHRWATGA